MTLEILLMQTPPQQTAATTKDDEMNISKEQQFLDTAAALLQIAPGSKLAELVFLVLLRFERNEYAIANMDEYSIQAISNDLRKYNEEGRVKDSSEYMKEYKEYLLEEKGLNVDAAFEFLTTANHYLSLQTQEALKALVFFVMFNHRFVWFTRNNREEFDLDSLRKIRALDSWAQAWTMAAIENEKIDRPVVTEA